MPAALQRRRERAAVEDGAVCEEVDGEAEAEGAQWLGMWPILEPTALGARRADSDAPRWQAVVLNYGIHYTFAIVLCRCHSSRSQHQHARTSHCRCVCTVCVGVPEVGTPPGARS